MEPPVRFKIGSSPTPSDRHVEGESPTDPDPDRPWRLTRSSSLQMILASISAERGSGGGGSSEGRAGFWTNLLVTHFLEEDEASSLSSAGFGQVGNGGADLKDDLVFYVRRRESDRNGEKGSGGGARSVEVHRKWQHNYQQILSDQLIDVEESVYLNLIMQHFSYTVTCAVCTRTGAKQLQILKRFSTRVFASPSRHCMDGKASREEITYPDIVFSVHNYDDLFADCVVRDSEILCVELVAKDRLGEFQGVLFLGSVRYEAILEVYAAKNGNGFSAYQPSTWFRAPRRVEFLRMRGPRGKGRAEVAVSRSEAAPPTPESEEAAATAAAEDAAPQGRTRRLSGTNHRQHQRQQLHPPSATATRVGSAASLRTWGLGGLMKKSRSDSENVEAAADRPQSPHQQPGGLSATPSEVEARGIEEELDEAAGGGGIWGQAWHWFKERRRASSIGLAACLTCVSLPWHRIVADLLDAGHQQQPVLAAFEELPGFTT